MDTLKAVLEAETGLAAEQQRLLHNGRDVAAGCVKEGWSADTVGSGWRGQERGRLTMFAATHRAVDSMTASHSGPGYPSTT